MGSLTSKPKAPKPQVVYMPAPTTAPAAGGATTTTPSSSGTSSSGAPLDGLSADEARAANLLLRARGAFGTVLTGFRGLLDPAAQAGTKKTLLGE